MAPFLCDGIIEVASMEWLWWAESCSSPLQMVTRSCASADQMEFWLLQTNRALICSAWNGTTARIGRLRQWLSASESDCWSDLSLQFGCIKKKKSRVYSVFSSMESSRDLSSIADVFCGPKTHFLQQVTSFPAASKHQNPETKPPAAHLRVHILLKLPRWRSELSLRGCTRNPKHVFIPALPYTPHNKHTLSHVRLPPADRNKCTHSFPNRPRSLQQ